jgi:hypothetical protein
MTRDTVAGDTLALRAMSAMSMGRNNAVIISENKR